MSTTNERSAIAVLNTQMKAVQADMTEVKADVKEIRTLLLTSSESGVSRHEFELYKKEQRTNKWGSLVGATLITAVVTALVFLALGVKK